jgi:hypothetical protein
MESKTKTLLASLLVLIVCVGCSGCATTTLHPIEKSDIFFIEKGTEIGEVVTEKDGYFLSELYLKEVAQTKVE